MSINDAIIRVKSAFAIWEQGGNLVSYDSIHEACELAVDALEKQIPRKVRITTSTKRCGSCGRQLSGIGNIHPERNYCQKCGQAIDWGMRND